jgi:hypothetical protein
MENPTEKTSSSIPSIDERDLILSMRKLDVIKELGFVLFLNKFYLFIYFSFLEKNKINYKVFKLISIKILI